MELTIWDARRPEDAARWAAVHGAWPQREVFAHPHFVRLFAGPGDRPLAAYLEWGGGSVLYPFVLRAIDAPHLRAVVPGATDITSPYGYGGAFRSCMDAAAAEVAAKEFGVLFDGFAARHRVVSEFVRLSLFPQQRLPAAGAGCGAGTDKPRAGGAGGAGGAGTGGSGAGGPGGVRDIPNVVRDLRTPPEAMWREFDHKVRKNVNKARRSGVTVEHDPGGARLDEFLRIYTATMDRRGAAAGYYFPRGFFRALIDDLPGQVTFFHARHGSRVVSTELVLCSAASVYSFLGGTDADAFESRPNDLLKFEIIEWARATGRTSFVLGGGYAPGDGIFRYKRAFAPGGVVPFQVSFRVLDPGGYARLCRAHRDEGGRRDPAWRPPGGFLPAYREPLPPGPLQ